MSSCERLGGLWTTQHFFELGHVSGGFSHARGFTKSAERFEIAQCDGHFWLGFVVWIGIWTSLSQLHGQGSVWMRLYGKRRSYGEHFEEEWQRTFPSLEFRRHLFSHALGMDFDPILQGSVRSSVHVGRSSHVRSHPKLGVRERLVCFDALVARPQLRHLSSPRFPSSIRRSAGAFVRHRFASSPPLASPTSLSFAAFPQA
mmetsp:Transcript_10905/g.67367  ORF Transcript_10905/g.67367 Transcript_10905/m.67367 type:complete len:201 (+) Transcript_10905:3160-3762(+)